MAVAAPEEPPYPTSRNLQARFWGKAVLRETTGLGLGIANRATRYMPVRSGKNLLTASSVGKPQVVVVQICKVPSTAVSLLVTYCTRNH